MAEADLHYLTITELAARIERRELSPVTLAQAQFDRIAALDSALHSYACLMADDAMAQARTAEAEIAAGHYRGPLHGVPIGIKDLCWTKGVPTSAGMAVHRDFRPGEDATVVRRLKQAGAVLLGKLQLTEGAYSDHHPTVIPPVNPWNADYWPGISSSGAGVATAAGLCHGAIASDTGGSIRWPSAANGVTGLKPTWGRVSRHGVFPLAPSLDHVGTMARSAADAGLLLAAVGGADDDDMTALRDPMPDLLAPVTDHLDGIRIGIDGDWNGGGHGDGNTDAGALAVIQHVTDVLIALGATIVPVRFPDVARTSEDWAANCAVEAAVAHAGTYPLHKDRYGPVLSSVIESGRALSGTDYQRVLLRRLELRGQVVALFDTIDLLLTPVHPFAPLSLETVRSLGAQPGLVAGLQRYTCPFNMTGHPTITLPGGLSPQGLPIGFQLVAAHLCESLLVRAGAAFQGATSWHRHHPVH